MVGPDILGNEWQPVRSTRLRGFVFDIYSAVESWSKDPGPAATEIGPSSRELKQDQPDITQVLDPLNVPNIVKSDAWNTFYAATSTESFRLAIDELPVPQQTKADLLAKKSAQVFAMEWNKSVAVERRTVHYQVATGLDWPRFFSQFGLALAAGLSLLWVLKQPLEAQSPPSENRPPLHAGRRDSARAPDISTPDSGQQQQSNDDLGLRNTLLVKCLWDEAVAERLMVYERERNPSGSVRDWLKAAIERWDHDNR